VDQAIVALAVRWLLAVVLIVASFTKFGRSKNFGETISQYDLVPDRVVAPLAAILPVAELLLGALLAAGALLVPTAILCACIFGLFAAAVAFSLVRGRSFDCGCGLGSHSAISWIHVARNLILSGLSALLAIQPAVLAIGGGYLRGAPGTRELLAVPLGVVLLCMTLKLVMPLRDTLSLLRRQRVDH
jgi:uncharacterized membrane protein YphA (DoxX/SURF4 family)